MKYRSHAFVAFAIPLLLALAREGRAEPPSTSTDLLQVTCADYMEGLRIADPGKHPSKARKAEAEEAQDDIVNGLMWIHG